MTYNVFGETLSLAQSQSQLFLRITHLDREIMTASFLIVRHASLTIILLYGRCTAMLILTST